MASCDYCKTLYFCHAIAWTLPSRNTKQKCHPINYNWGVDESGYTPCMHVVWFKRDLRIHDHIPLSTLAYIPVYILEPDLWNEPDMSTRQFLF